MSRNGTKSINLTESCLFLQVQLSRMGDKRGVNPEEVEVDTDKDRIKIRKVIFKSAAFDAIKSLDSEVRRYVHSQCFPFEAGLHIVPLPFVEQMTNQLDAFHSRRIAYVTRFVEVFPYLIGDQQSKLRKLFNINDYKTDIHSHFFMGWKFFMITAPSTLEGINEDIFKQERLKMESRFAEAANEARTILRETCLALVVNLRSSLEDDIYGLPKRLSSSSVTKLQNFLNSFELRNITNDTELQTYIRQAKQLTSGVDIESLRTLNGLRDRVRTELSHIEENIINNLEVQPARRIRIK